MNTQVVSPIRKYRDQAGLTQAELGAKAGISQSRLANYELLLRTPDIETARTLLKVLKSSGARVTSVDDLYPRTPN